MLSMQVSMGKYLCVLLMFVLVKSATSCGSTPSSAVCPRDFKTYLYDLNSQCPFSNPFGSSPLQVDGESFEKAIGSTEKNEYTAVLFYASCCPFSRMFLSKFSTLSAIYPQINHLILEQSSAMPSVFSKYGIHSVPSLLMVSRKTRVLYHGRKDMSSLMNFYKRTTGLYPVMNLAEEMEGESSSKAVKLWHGASLKQTCAEDTYLLISMIFVFMRFFLYFYPEMSSRITALWRAYIPRPNLAIFGESRQLLGQVVHLIDIKRMWSKMKNCKNRNFHRGARNAGKWASSLSSVSLGKIASHPSERLVS